MNQLVKLVQLIEFYQCYFLSFDIVLCLCKTLRKGVSECGLYGDSFVSKFRRYNAKYSSKKKKNLEKQRAIDP